MTKEERIRFLAQATVELFASSQDALLQEFQVAASNGDDESLTYAAVALWQLNKSMMDFFKNVTVEGLKYAGSATKANEIAHKVQIAVRDRMKAIATQSRGGNTEMIVAPKEEYDSIQDAGVAIKSRKPDPSFN